MAHVEHNTVLTGLNKGYYNVTSAVGPAGTAPNRRDDVLLVQYLLKGIAENPKFTSYGFSWTPPEPTKSFLVDGLMGRQTAAWIKSYQKAANEITSGSILVDNRIDPARGPAGSISRTTYTILALNIDFDYVQGEKFNALEDAADAPFELREAIRRTRPQGIISVYPTDNSL